MLPLRLVSFWYTNSFKTFLRILTNSISLVEEDLAVGLNTKLLFTPLFHDSSLVGRFLSFFFRLTRIWLGLMGYLIASLIVVIIAFIWFASPLLLFSRFYLLGGATLIFGLGLFVYQVVDLPEKKFWQIKSSKDIWKATKLTQKDVNFNNLVKSPEVEEILLLLELSDKTFSFQNISVSEGLLSKVYDLGKKMGAKYITSGYFFVGMLYQIRGVEDELLKINLSLKDFEGSLNFLEQKRTKKRVVNIWDEEFGVKHLKGVNRGWLGVPTPSLDSVSEDLTKRAAKDGVIDFVGRSAAVSEIVTVLSENKNQNAILVGPAGVGKTTIVEYLAKLIVKGDAPKSLATKRLVSLDLTRLLSGIETEGDLAGRIRDVFDEVRFSGEIIIFVDEIQNLGIGEAGTHFNLFSLILPYLESNEFQFLAATEEEEYERVVEKNSAFIRLFTKIEIPPANIDEAKEIVIDRVLEEENKGKLRVSYLAIRDLVELSSKLIHDRVLPDSALANLTETEAVAEKGWITSQSVKTVLGKRVNVPMGDLDADKKDLLLHLEDTIHQRMVDQEGAVKAVADTLRRAAVELREKSRPIGSFLFVGPTGVGKTELAKTLAEIYFDNQGVYLRYDMSEYQTPEAVDRLIGTVDTPGELTEAVRNKPYALLLLDEFEKADPKILNLFLQVLEDGRLTDASGKHTDFTNTIIIATSNAGSILIAEGLENGVNMEELKKQVNEKLLETFRPELVNRFDEVVIFKTLSQDDLDKIVSIKLQAVKDNLKEKGYLVDFAPDLISELGKRGFDPVLGARPMRRLVQDTLESRLSTLILENKLSKGQTFQAGVELLA